jgi:hypothetical protein
MTKLARLAAGTAVTAAVAFLPLPAVAQTSDDAAVTARPVPAVDGPLDLIGELDGVPYEIRVPAGWNGTLVMYAHGYRDAADHPGERDDRSAQAFVADPVEQQMLAAGYAVAGSAYAANGWSVKEGVHDTKALLNHFRDTVAKPTITLVAGFSMGSLVAFESIERYGALYDGAMPSCAVGAGAPRTWDGTQAIAAAYDAVFGWPKAWGTPSDVRDDLDFEKDVAPTLLSRLNAPGGTARFEFLRLVTGVPKGPEWPLTVWFFVTEARAELERRAGGPVTQSLTHNYTLSTADRAQLTGMGLADQQIDGWLDHMNGDRVAATPGPRGYLERYADYTGRVDGPVLTLGTRIDSLVVPASISAYAETVAAAGGSDRLAHAWTSGTGHCNFTPSQLLTSVRALERWVATGDRPASFPAEQGFVDFTPPPWPQP